MIGFPLDCSRSRLSNLWLRSLPLLRHSPRITWRFKRRQKEEELRRSIFLLATGFFSVVLFDNLQLLHFADNCSRPCQRARSLFPKLRLAPICQIHARELGPRFATSREVPSLSVFNPSSTPATRVVLANGDGMSLLAATWYVTKNYSVWPCLPWTLASAMMMARCRIILGRRRGSQEEIYCSHALLNETHQPLREGQAPHRIDPDWGPERRRERYENATGATKTNRKGSRGCGRGLK
jgi:hypothetical protein